MAPKKKKKKNVSQAHAAQPLATRITSLRAALGLLMPKTKLQAVTTHERPLLIIA
jgi:hypothetical protein